MQIKQIILTIITAIGLVACQNSNLSHPQDTLRVDLAGDINTFDPQTIVDFNSFRVLSDLNEGIIDMDQSNRPKAGMAESWTISSDGKTYLFKLRPDLHFSDGTTLTAKDFVYSWQRLINPKTGGYSFIIDHVKNAKQIIAGKLNPNQLGVFAVTNTLLKVELDAPDPAFLAKLTAVFSTAVPRHVIEQYGESWTSPQHLVTNGAYKLDQHIVNGEIKLTKNQDFYQANQVTIPKLVFIPYTDRNAALAAYKSGDLDIVTGVPIDQYRSIQSEFNNQLHTVKMEGMAFYSLNTRLPELKSREVRQALSMAIDREVLAKQILGTGQTGLYSYVTPTIENARYRNLDYSWRSVTRDQQIKLAQQLYAKAGYDKVSALKLTILYDNNDASRKVAIAIADMWKTNLGVNVTLSSQDWKSYLQSRKTGAFVVIRNNWGAAYNMITTYTPEYQCNSEVNVSGLCLPMYDGLLSQADSEHNEDKQTALYRKAIFVAMNEYASIPLYQNSYTMLIKPYVRGLDVESNLLEDIRSKWIQFDN